MSTGSGWPGVLKRGPAAALVALALVGLVLVAACGSSNAPKATSTPGRITATTPATPAHTSQSASSSASGQLSGTWQGTSASDNHPERKSRFTVVFTQNGKSISGPITITGGCISAGRIKGTLTGQRIEFGVIENAAVEFTGTISGNTMSGTFKTEPPCGYDKDTGTWQATRTG